MASQLTGFVELGCLMGLRVPPTGGHLAWCPPPPDALRGSADRLLTTTWGPEVLMPPGGESLTHLGYHMLGSLLL